MSTQFGLPFVEMDMGGPKEPDLFCTGRSRAEQSAGPLTVGQKVVVGEEDALALAQVHKVSMDHDLVFFDIICGFFESEQDQLQAEAGIVCEQLNVHPTADPDKLAVEIVRLINAYRADQLWRMGLAEDGTAEEPSAADVQTVRSALSTGHLDHLAGVSTEDQRQGASDLVDQLRVKRQPVLL